MRKYILSVIGLCLISTLTINAQSIQEKYKKAEEFLSWNLSEKLYSLTVNPQWIDESSNFWFLDQKKSKKEFILVNSKKKRMSAAFNHKKMADALTSQLGRIISADSLPFNYIKFINHYKGIRFKIKSKTYSCDLKSYVLKVQEKEEKEKRNPFESSSPDKKWKVIVKDFNLYLLEIDSKEEFQLTKDGKENFSYGFFNIMV